LTGEKVRIHNVIFLIKKTRMTWDKKKIIILYEKRGKVLFAIKKKIPNP